MNVEDILLDKTEDSRTFTDKRIQEAVDHALERIPEGKFGATLRINKGDGIKAVLARNGKRWDVTMAAFYDFKTKDAGVGVEVLYTWPD